MRKTYSFKRDVDGTDDLVGVAPAHINDVPVFCGEEFAEFYPGTRRAKRIWVTVSDKPVPGWDEWLLVGPCDIESLPSGNIVGLNSFAATELKEKLGGERFWAKVEHRR